MYITTNRLSNESPQLTQSVDFNGISFILAESTVFERFLHNIDVMYYIVYIMHS